MFWAFTSRELNSLFLSTFRFMGIKSDQRLPKSARQSGRRDVVDAPADQPGFASENCLPLRWIARVLGAIYYLFVDGMMLPGEPFAHQCRKALVFLMFLAAAFVYNGVLFLLDYIKLRQAPI